VCVVSLTAISVVDLEVAHTILRHDRAQRAIVGVHRASGRPSVEVTRETPATDAWYA
jgi:hypothetical protein